MNDDTRLNMNISSTNSTSVCIFLKLIHNHNINCTIAAKFYNLSLEKFVNRTMKNKEFSAGISGFAGFAVLLAQTQQSLSMSEINF